MLAHNVGKKKCNSSGESPIEYQHRAIGGSRATHEQWFQNDAGKWRVADGVRGNTAYEAKFVTGKWGDSLYNPKSVTTPKGFEAHSRNLAQMIDYSNKFDTVVYISNSKALLQSIRRMAKANNLRNVRARFRR